MIKIKEVIAKIVGEQRLEFNEVQEVIDEIVMSKCTPAQISSFIVALWMKKEGVRWREKLLDPVDPEKKECYGMS